MAHKNEEPLSVGNFFDIEDFQHRELFENDVHYVWDVLRNIDDYLKNWFIENKPSQQGDISPQAYIDDQMPVWIGEGTRVEAGAYIVGPTIIGRNCEIRSGAYIRGSVITGDRVVLGNSSEAKHSLLLDGSHAAHFNYLGDSVCGRGVNLGAGVKFANLPHFSKKDKKTGLRPSIVLRIDGHAFDTGLSKLGGIVGDHTEIGCNSVLNPGTLLGRDCAVYPLVSIAKGYYPSNTIIKLRQNLEMGVLRRTTDNLF